MEPKTDAGADSTSLQCPRCGSHDVDVTAERHTCRGCVAFGWPSIGSFAAGPVVTAESREPLDDTPDPTAVVYEMHEDPRTGEPLFTTRPRTADDYRAYALRQLQIALEKDADAPASSASHERAALVALTLERRPTAREVEASWLPAPSTLAGDGHQPPRLDAGEEAMCDGNGGCFRMEADLLALRAENQRLRDERDVLSGNFKLAQAQLRQAEKENDMGDAALAEARAEHQRLTEERDAMQRRAESAESDWQHCEAEVTRLSEALETYGQHTMGCEIPGPQSSRMRLKGQVCSCGFAAVLQERKK